MRYCIILPYIFCMNNRICCIITASLYNKTIINSLTIKALRVHSDWVSVDERLVHVSVCLNHVSSLQTQISRLTDLTIVLNSLVSRHRGKTPLVFMFISAAGW